MAARDNNSRPKNADLQHVVPKATLRKLYERAIYKPRSNYFPKIVQKNNPLSVVSQLWPVQIAHCETSETASKPKEVSSFIKRADNETLKEIFFKYASIEKDGQHYMSYDDFVLKFLGLLPATDHDEKTLVIYGSSCDLTKDGLISFMEFQAFEGLLCLPDAMYALAFQLFDVNNSGAVTFDEFRRVVSHTDTCQHIPFNFACDMVQMHFGCKRRREVNYTEFTQLFHDLHEEHALQAFRRFDKDDRGFITSLDFNEIMTTLKGHLLTSFVKEKLVEVCGIDDRAPGAKLVSYPFFTAFISLLNNMELCKQIYKSATKNHLSAQLTKEEFLHETQKYSQITPLEVDILFRLVDAIHPDGESRYSSWTTGRRLTYSDLQNLAPLEEDRMPYRIQAQQVQEKLQELAAGKGRGVLIQVLESAYRFLLGSIAGCVGATIVYPIDLVKTRMQNQRTGAYVGELMYKNSIDCFKKVIRHEGILGLYRGLAPQLVGVAPEKAIKLTMNDLIRDKMTGGDGEIPVWGEMVAGGTAGACQVMFTNPLEIVKIRLQVSGEVVTAGKVRALTVIKELGFFGLYKGARACLLRDIPFSAIYFPAYAHMKKATADADGYNGYGSLLLSATTAGAPAAYFTTPADVIKTRLQVQAREGQTSYNGMFDCARKIWSEEGGRAFWKGGPARIFRSAPQFGFTLLTYELLQRMFYIDFGGRRPQGSELKPSLEEMLPQNPDHIGGYRLALATFEGIETKFGLSMPKYRRPETVNS